MIGTAHVNISQDRCLAIRLNLLPNGSCSHLVTSAYVAETPSVPCHSVLEFW